MWQRLVVVGLLASCIQAFNPAPIQWGGVDGNKFVLASALGQLTIGDVPGKQSSSVMPYFSANRDSTISWQAKEWCLEADGSKTGDAVQLNHCNGAPNQAWNWLPWGPIQLKGTNKCLDVTDRTDRSIGAPIKLQECENKATESWRFGTPVVIQDPSYSMHHVMVSVVAMVAIGALSLYGWLWRRPSKASVGMISEGGVQSNVDQVGVSLTKPIDMSQDNTSLFASNPAVMVVSAQAVTSSTPKQPSAARMPAARMAAVNSTLIIQNKGGGHGEIGYHLALELKEKGMDVMILHEGPNKADKPPHSKYGDLTNAGVDIQWFDSLEAPEAVAAVKDKKFDAVVDNWSKSPEQIRPYAELAKGWGVENYAYVSSAGMYTPAKGDYGAIGEETAVKSTGQRQAEELLGELQLPYACFRPQYIYGPIQGKSYLKYFFDRVTRGRPVLVPNDGNQNVTMTHAADNAGMIAAAIGNEGAKGEIFNCSTSSLITYDELASLCGKAAGVDSQQIVHYDPKDFEIPKGFFPFRDTPFFVSADKAASTLGFEPKNQLTQDIEWYYKENYVGVGAADKEVDFALDDEILAKVAK